MNPIILLNDHLREFMSRYCIHRNHLIAENNRYDIAFADKTRNMKQINTFPTMLPDLDDGVKVNYCKFGGTLKKILGLEPRRNDEKR